MKIDGEYVFDAKVQEVWDALFDPAVLAAAMPGCEKLELVDGSYIGDIKVKVGPIQGKFSGKVDLSDQVPPKSYKMTVDGRGAQGFVKATATLELSPEEDGAKTRVKYDSDAQVGGKIASVGQRLVETSAKAIIKQSLENLSENIKIRAQAYRAHDVEAAPTPPEPAPAPPVLAVVPEPKAEASAPPVTTGDDVTRVEAAAARVEAAAARVEAAATRAESAAKSAVAAANKPVIQYKQAEAGQMASAVAKDVAKTYAPMIVVVLALFAFAIYWFAVR